MVQHTVTPVQMAYSVLLATAMPFALFFGRQLNLRVWWWAIFLIAGQGVFVVHPITKTGLNSLYTQVFHDSGRLMLLSFS